IDRHVLRGGAEDGRWPLGHLGADRAADQEIVSLSHAPARALPAPAGQEARYFPRTRASASAVSTSRKIASVPSSTSATQPAFAANSRLAPASPSSASIAGKNARGQSTGLPRLPACTGTMTKPTRSRKAAI